MRFSIGREVYQIRPPSEPSEFMDNHTWFNKAVARWLDIALYKAMQRITKAVELDDLEPVDDMAKHSSSAVDITTVMSQIKTFWKQLAWPDAEAAYAYMSKILDVSVYSICGSIATSPNSSATSSTSSFCSLLFALLPPLCLFLFLAFPSFSDNSSSCCGKYDKAN